MTLVQNTLTSAGGAPFANQGISVRLVCSGFVDVSKLQILSVAYGSTDEAGAYSFELVPNSQIDPEGTYYEVTHPNGEILAFIVSDATGPLWLRDLLVSSPAHPGGVVAGVTSAQLSSAIAEVRAESEPVGLSDATKTVLSGTYGSVAAVAPATALPALDYTGSTDATAAINAALTDGVSVVLAAGTLAISGVGIVIPANVNFNSSQCTLIYTGTGSAVTVGPNETSGTGAGEVGNLSRVVIGKVKRAALDWFANGDTTSVGVALTNCNWRQVTIMEVANFETGVLLVGDANGTAYNSIHLGRIANNRRAVRFAAISAGWANSNNFYGGVLRVDSAYAWNGTDASTAATASVLIDGSTIGNGNNFFGTVLEGGAPWRVFRWASTTNSLWNCRLESAPAGSCEFLAGSYGNCVYGGYGNNGPGSAMFSDAGLNIIMGGRGMNAYSDTGGGSPENGGHAAYEALSITAAADVLFRGRNSGGASRWEVNAAGMASHFATGAYPVLKIDPTTASPLNGGGYSAGRGNVAPDVGFGRSPDNQASWIASAPILRKTVTLTLAANGGVSFNAYQADVQVVILKANATVVAINTAATAAGWSQVLTLEMVQDGTGGRTWVAPANVKWAGGSAPTLSTAANVRDVFVLRYDPSVTAWVEVSRSMNVG